MANIIDRARAEALIQEQVVSTIFQDAPKQSVFMSLARKLPNMTSKQTRIPVLDMLPVAYWVNGDTGFKQTSQQAWDNVYLTAAELAVIVPIPEAVLDDADFDILGEVTPRVNEAIGARVDAAVLFGTNRPSEWQNDIITMARQAGNNVSGDPTGISGRLAVLTDKFDAMLNRLESFGDGRLISLSDLREALKGLHVEMDGRDVGGIEGGVEVSCPLPEALADFTLHHTAYKLAEDGRTLVLDADKRDADADAAALSALRTRRERECFTYINRGQLWYARLSAAQLAELSAWYIKWLDVTRTRQIPDKPAWLDEL
ncbi:phage major capsid protein [Anaeromassilibacillus senegalensis]|uniref:phage major capsid protein n=1 Tax=Anaeromassilibacillus senegalensis TaxID=1673717 RepID=UPI001F33AAAC|nr:phage major capsid protein [Anaeromassilibacillus senegalensis]